MNIPFAYRYQARSVLRRGSKAALVGAWLHGDERVVYGQIRHPRRREAWLFGRMLAKQLIMETMNTPADGAARLTPEAILICSRDGLGRPTRPYIVVGGQVMGWSLSIAHSDRHVLAALSAAPGLAVGADINPIEALSDGFIDTWMTPWERTWLATRGAQPWGSRLWAIKEALYKAVNTGERFAPSRIEVRPSEPIWTPALDRLLTPSGFELRVEGVTLTQPHTVFLADVDAEVTAIVTIAQPGAHSGSEVHV